MNNLIQVEDNLEYWKTRENQLTNFLIVLNNSVLPQEVERKINLEISSEINICKSEKEQLSLELNEYTEEMEAIAELQNKYQDRVKIEE